MTAVIDDGEKLDDSQMRSAVIRLDELEEVELELPYTLEEIYMDFYKLSSEKAECFLDSL